MRPGRASPSPLTLAAVILVAASGCRGAHPPIVRTRREAATHLPSATTDGAGVYAGALEGKLSPVVKGIPERVYVPDSGGHTVDVIDQSTMKIVARFDVGKNPQHVTPAWDLRTLYVDNDQSNTLTPIDPKTGKPGPAFRVDDPYNLYFTPDGTKAIVVAERSRRLDVRDPPTWKLMKAVAIPYSGPNHLDFSPDGSYLLLSCEFSGWLVKVDLQRLDIAGSLHVGGKPADVRLAADGSVFYVANERRGGVSVVDPAAMKELGFVPTGKGTHGLVISRDGRSLYVTNRLAGSVSVVDFATRKVTATWKIGGSPDMGGVSADGRLLWLSGRYKRTRVRNRHAGGLPGGLDPRRQAAARRVRVPAAGPLQPGAHGQLPVT